MKLILLDSFLKSLEYNFGVTSNNNAIPSLVSLVLFIPIQWFNNSFSVYLHKPNAGSEI